MSVGDRSKQLKFRTASSLSQRRHATHNETPSLALLKSFILNKISITNQRNRTYSAGRNCRTQVRSQRGGHKTSSSNMDGSVVLSPIDMWITHMKCFPTSEPVSDRFTSQYKAVCSTTEKQKLMHIWHKSWGVGPQASQLHPRIYLAAALLHLRARLLTQQKSLITLHNLVLQFRNTDGTCVIS